MPITAVSADFSAAGAGPSAALAAGSTVTAGSTVATGSTAAGSAPIAVTTSGWVSSRWSATARAVGYRKNTGGGTSTPQARRIRTLSSVRRTESTPSAPNRSVSSTSSAGTPSSSATMLATPSAS